MIRTYNRVPDFNQPLTQKGTTAKGWFFFWQGLWSGIPPGAETPLTLTGSPFVYTAPSRGFVIVNGGTVSNVQFKRSTQNYITGASSGCFPVSAQDILTITYSVAPTVTFVPQ